jgi:Phytanoyl-CoA dioxygenase (PhyH)
LSQVSAVAAAEALEAEGRLLEAIESLTSANRHRPSADIEERLVRLRYEAFGSLDRSRGLEAWPRSMADPFPDVVDAPPEVSLESITPRLLGGSIVHHGCLVVRNLVSSVGVERLVDGIKCSFECRDKHQDGAAPAQTAPWYVPFDPGFSRADRFGKRNYIRTVDSPRALFALLGAFDEVGLSSIISAHLGERPALSANKCALRRVPPDEGGTDFHQDGAFLGRGIRALNVWLALSHCGGDADARGLEFVPRRLGLLGESARDSAAFDWAVSATTAERVADGMISRPVFAPGDALLFDELLLHRTAAAARTQDRYAIESWFFAPSCYPENHVPVVC